MNKDFIEIPEGIPWEDLTNIVKRNGSYTGFRIMVTKKIHRKLLMLIKSRGS